MGEKEISKSFLMEICERLWYDKKKKESGGDKQMKKTVMDRIFSSYDSFFESEKKIGSYIMNHSQDVIDMTVVELAQACGVSEASVSRFCKKIELRGFHDLKISLAKEVTEQKADTKVSNCISVSDIGQSLQNILANKVEELSQTVAMMDENQLDEMLHLIQNARIVQFVAAGNTIPVAIYGAYNFNQLGIASVAGSIWEAQIAYTYNMTKEDVMIAISNSGESMSVINTIEAAKEVGVKIISVTNNDKSTVAQLSDYHITTATREKLFLDGYYFSRVSAITVIEILYLFLAYMNPEAYKNITRHEESIAGDKI